ncbi:zinc finger protein 2 homolog isoform X7 [Micropterus dolomieu]|uniref:zinc finger protein 2 homolog isoform X7 n=1 Tax=Micropterus dolomieu TaxID=147949 RepID=UPI001E8D29DC|nr:zinc finger protein 2 homolog isoform X7 [Micropterus dolomieu]
MSSVESLREFVNERLTAAAEEIFRVFKNTMFEYEEEIDRQRRLLDIVWKPEVKLHRIELPQQHVCKEKIPGLDQEDPQPPQVKEEQEELCTSQEGEQLVVKQETDTFMLTPTYEESDHSEAELKSDHQLLSHNCHVAESQDQKGGEHEDSGSTRDAEPKQKNQDHNSRSPRNNVHKSTMSEVHHDPHTELPQQHVCKEEEVLADQQLWIQERIPGLDQEDPQPPQVKEEQEELCTSQEGEQLVVKQETDTFMLTPTYEESDHSEAELKSDHQLLSHNCHVAESQDQKGGEHEDSGSTKDAEPKQKNQDHNSRSPRNNVRKSTMSEVHHNPHTGKNSFTCDTCGKQFQYKSEFQRHLRIHTAITFSTCNTCGKVFHYKSEMRRHMRMHTGERPYSCKTCGKDFTTTTSLLCHTRTHSGEKPFSCETCGKSFSRRNNLQVHMKTHTGEKPYVCETCGKNFRISSHLQLHIRTHTGEKPYLCKTCGKRFSDISALRRHTRLHTELPQQHVCKEEEVLAEQQLWIQERIPGLDQEDPQPPQVKEEQEELLTTSQEGEQLVVKQETDTFMLTPTYEESNHSEAELKSDHQLLSHNCHVAESQDQKRGKQEDSGSTSDAEPKLKNQDHKWRSPRNNVHKSTMSEVHHNPHTGKKYFTCDTWKRF